MAEAALEAGVVMLAAFIKGAIGFGFPTLATPVLTLFVDPKAAVVALLLPNIVMDGIQFARRGAPLATVRRFAVLLLCGGAGTVLGTRLLVVLPSRQVTLILGSFLLLFVALNVTPWSPRVPAGWERRLSPVVGLLAGVIGGLTNGPGTPVIIYFYALGMEKYEFVRSVALAFIVYKVVQLGAVSAYGLLTWPRLGASLGLTAVALGGFRVGLRLQDRLDPRAFNRAILGFLTAVGAWLVGRALL